jgi:hypothetical protein
MVVHDWGSLDPFRPDGAGWGSGFVGRDSTGWGHQCLGVLWHDAPGRWLARRMRRAHHESHSVIGENGTCMECLKCKGFMLVERHYTLVNRRIYARCLNCGFWIDLADLLRFFHKVIDSGRKGDKVRESFIF